MGYTSEEDVRLDTPYIEVRDNLRTLEEAGLENKLPIYDDGRMIVEEGHMALKDDMNFVTRKYRAPCGLEELELRQEGKSLDAAGILYVSLTEYKKADPTTPSPLSVGTPGDKRSPQWKQTRSGRSGKGLYHAGITSGLEWGRLGEPGFPTPGISPQKSGAAFDERNLQHGKATLECARKQEEPF